PSTPTSPTTSTTPSTPTSSCTDSCTLGTRGCDGDTAWRCVEGASGCAVKASTACPSGTCLTGTCLDSSTSCYGIDDVGVCYNDAVYYCSEQQLYRLDCPQSGRHCGFSTSHSYYDCL
ncbi:MAG: hypothetical protein KC609_02175, partial [Myxococcales bacterium]|nr:hypothetical protein [Myxococcales bacterium]